MKKIADLRAENGNLSQRQLADALEVTQASVSRWEANQRIITGRNLIKLAKYFNVTTDKLLGLEKEDIKL